MENNEIRFPMERVKVDTYRCPCGNDGIHLYKSYYTGLDDADYNWGGYDESYGFDPDDPCYKKYRIVRVYEDNSEFILKIKD